MRVEEKEKKHDFFVRLLSEIFLLLNHIPRFHTYSKNTTWLHLLIPYTPSRHELWNLSFFLLKKIKRRVDYNKPFTMYIYPFLVPTPHTVQVHSFTAIHDTFRSSTWVNDELYDDTLDYPRPFSTTLLFTQQHHVIAGIHVIQCLQHPTKCTKHNYNCGLIHNLMICDMFCSNVDVTFDFLLVFLIKWKATSTPFQKNAKNIWSHIWSPFRTQIWSYILFYEHLCFLDFHRFPLITHFSLIITKYHT